MAVVGETPKRGRTTGTSISFWPDPTIFQAEGTEFVARTVLERLQTMAFLNKGLEIVFIDERPEREQTITYQYKGGLVDFVKHLNASKEPLFSKVCNYEDYDDEGQTLDIAIQWNTGYYEGVHGYANGISTIEGGMHVEGFRTALTTVANKWAREKNLLKEKDVNLTGEDIREGITAIISVKLREPQFEGQTKAKLGNVPMRSFVQKATNERLAEWFSENPTEANKVIKKALSAAQARVAAKNARNAIRRKTALVWRRHARQVERLLVEERLGIRTVHRRRRLRWRHGTRCTRPPHAGDSSHSRQDPQRRASPYRQDDEEH